jgi:hypothetical protein
MAALCGAAQYQGTLLLVIQKAQHQKYHGNVSVDGTNRPHLYRQVFIEYFPVFVSY